MKKLSRLIVGVLLSTLLVSCGNNGGTSVAPSTSATSVAPSTSSEPAKVYYTVAFNGNGGTLVSGNELQKVSSPNDIVAPVYEREGFTFSNWDKDITTINTDSIVKAEWNINVYKVTFESNGGSEVASQNVSYLGYVREPENPIRLGYAFLGWYADSSLSTPFNFYTQVKEDLTIYAKWNEYFTVEFESNGGSLISPINVQSGDKVIRPTNPTKESYTFVDWYKDEELQNVYDFNSAVTGDLKLYAGWTINEYVVSFNTNEGSSINPQVVKHGEFANKPVNPTKPGYTFAKWTYKGNDFNFETTPITESIELNAVWNVATYTITYVMNGGYNDLDNPSTYTIFDEITFKNGTKFHHSFAGWYIGDVKVTGIKKGTYGNITVSAKFIINSYDVILHVNDTTMGSVSGSGRYEYGSLVTVTATPVSQGYKFEGWYSDSEYKTLKSSMNPYPFKFEKDGNLDIYAKFSINTYTITYVMNGGTNSSLNPATYTIRDEVSLSTPTKTENSFLGWKKGDNYVTSIPLGSTGNITLEAKWQANQYDVTATVKDSTLGSVTGTGTYDYDASVTLTAHPTEGYKVKGWYADAEYSELLSEKTNYTFSNPSGGKHVYLDFMTEAEYQVKWNKEHGVTPVIDETNKKLTYGFFPQDKVSNPSSGLVSEANKHSEEEIFVYDEEYYVKDKGNPVEYTSSGKLKVTFRDGTEIVKDQTYYFKCSPIVWNIHSELTSTRYSLDSKDVLYASSFGDTKSFSESDVLKPYLNTTFYNKAFAFDKTKIEETELEDVGGTYKIFVPSYSQLSYQWYSDATRNKSATDFARCNYCAASGDTSIYWSRTEHQTFSSTVYCVSIDGDMGCLSSYADKYGGIVPSFTFINE